MAAIQGVHVSVFLGSVDLDYDFYCNWGIQIVHVMLLSWSGENLQGNTLTDAEKEMRRRRRGHQRLCTRSLPYMKPGSYIET